MRCASVSAWKALPLQHHLADRLVDHLVKARHMRALLLVAQVHEALHAREEQLLTDPYHLLHPCDAHAREAHRDRRHACLHIVLMLQRLGFGARRRLHYVASLASRPRGTGAGAERGARHERGTGTARVQHGRGTGCAARVQHGRGTGCAARARHEHDTGTAWARHGRGGASEHNRHHRPLIDHVDQPASLPADSGITPHITSVNSRCNGNRNSRHVRGLKISMEGQGEEQQHRSAGEVGRASLAPTGRRMDPGGPK